MSPAVIVIIISIAVLLAVGITVIIAMFVKPPRVLVDNKPVLGTVQYHTKSRIPGLKQAVVCYTRRGRPYTAATRPMPAKMLPKIKTKRMYMLCVIKKKDGSSQYWLDTDCKSEKSK